MGLIKDYTWRPTGILHRDFVQRFCIAISYRDLAPGFSTGIRIGILHRDFVQGFCTEISHRDFVQRFGSGILYRDSYRDFVQGFCTGFSYRDQSPSIILNEGHYGF